MKEFRAFLFLVVSGMSVAGVAVWAQVQRVRLGYEIHDMQMEYRVLQDDVLKVQRRLHERRSPQALQAQMERFKIDLQRPTGARFVDPRLQAPAADSVTQ